MAKGREREFSWTIARGERKGGQLDHMAKGEVGRLNHRGREVSCTMAKGEGEGGQLDHSKGEREGGQLDHGQGGGRSVVPWPREGEGGQL